MEDFSVIYRTYSPGLFKYLYYQTGDKHLAEELLQETFFQAYKSLHRFRGDSLLSTWLFGIARNVLHRHWAKAKLPTPETANNQLDSPEAIVTAQESERELLFALGSIVSPYQEVVILRAFNDLSFKEIGQLLGRDESWARVTFYRAKLKLKAHLEEV